MQIKSEKDIEITCCDCGDQFTFTERDQDFYQSKGFSQPKRCRNCRAKKKRNFEEHEKRRFYK